VIGLAMLLITLHNYAMMEYLGVVWK
jgi:hypothetical protein